MPKTKLIQNTEYSFLMGTSPLIAMREEKEYVKIFYIIYIIYILYI